MDEGEGMERGTESERAPRGYRPLVALLVALLAMPAVGAAADDSRPGGTDDAAASVGSWIVTFHDEHPAGVHASATARRYGGEARYVYEHILNGFNFRGSQAAADNLGRNPRVRTIVPDREVAATAESIPTGVRRVRARHDDGEVATAHTSGHRGAGARIAILDSGIDLEHVDLVDNLDVDLGKNCIDPDSPPQDVWGHGTHVAGTAAAVGGNSIGVVGVADQARLVPIKVLDDSGRGDWSTVACGIDHAVGLTDAGDATTPVDVINMSLGGPVEEDHNCENGGLRQAICEAVEAGLVAVTSAGNDGFDASQKAPAAYPEAITVSALADSDGEPGGTGPCLASRGRNCLQSDDSFASFSNYGPSVDVIAPGYAINSTVPGDAYRSADGTSMAAPHVAGIAALMRAIKPSASPAEVLAVLQRTGECPDGTSAGGPVCDSTKGSWLGDPDGITEPLTNADQATAEMAALVDDPTPGELSADPVALGFGEVTVDTGETLAVTLTNSGEQAVTIEQFTFGGDDAAMFTVTGAPPGTVAAGGTAMVEVTFTPTAAGEATATLTITHDGTNTPTC